MSSLLETYFSILMGDIKNVEKGNYSVSEIISYVIVFGGRG